MWLFCVSPLLYFTENPPSAKQPSKMLVIKKVSKEDPAAAFSAAFTSSGSHHANGNKVSTMVPSVYKNLVPKPAPPPSKVWALKNRFDNKSYTIIYIYIFWQNYSFRYPVSACYMYIIILSSPDSASANSPVSFCKLVPLIAWNLSYQSAEHLAYSWK